MRYEWQRIDRLNKLLLNKNSLGGEMVDTRDSKSRAAKRGGSSPLQGKKV